jgi:putative SOS response-associated peptidase YedK
MCGRYTQTSNAEDIKRLIDFDGEDRLLQPRFNIAPMQAAPVVTADRELKALRWGLVPAWAKDEQTRNPMINARSETVAEKPAFKQLLKRRRCLVLANGFYEWQKTGRARQPYYFRLRDHAPFAFAGLWDRWHAPDGRELETFLILTTEANELLRSVHRRMPVLLLRDGCAPWLDLDGTPPDHVLSWLRPFDPEQMTGHPVSLQVNSPRTDHPDCIRPLPASSATLEFDLGR